MKHPLENLPYGEVSAADVRQALRAAINRINELEARYEGHRHRTGIIEGEYGDRYHGEYIEDGQAPENQGLSWLMRITKH